MDWRLFLIAMLVTHSGASAAAAKWGPVWSEVTGNLYPTARMHLLAAVVSKVDGVSRTERIVKMDPGKRTVVMRSPMRKGFSGSDVSLDLDIKPCTRYYINAQFKNSTGPDWEPVIAHEERVSGCKLPKTS